MELENLLIVMDISYKCLTVLGEKIGKIFIFDIKITVVIVVRLAFHETTLSMLQKLLLAEMK